MSISILKARQSAEETRANELKASTSSSRPSFQLIATAAGLTTPQFEQTSQGELWGRLHSLSKKEKKLVIKKVITKYFTDETEKLLATQNIVIDTIASEG